MHPCNPKYHPLVLGFTGRSALPGDDCFDRAMSLQASAAPPLARLPSGTQPCPGAQSAAPVGSSALTLNFLCSFLFFNACNFISNLLALREGEVC